MTALADTIDAQPRLLSDVLDRDVGAEAALLDGCDRLWLVGTGTSQHAAELGAWLLGTAGRDARARLLGELRQLRPEAT